MQGAYASSKGTVEQLTNVLALEWAQAGVQVNAIAPAYCEAPLTKSVFNDQERNRCICERTLMGRWRQPSGYDALRCISTMGLYTAIPRWWCPWCRTRSGGLPAASG